MQVFFSVDVKLKFSQAWSLRHSSSIFERRFRMGNSRHLFLYYRLLNIILKQFIVLTQVREIADDWIRSADLCCRNLPIALQSLSLKASLSLAKTCRYLLLIKIFKVTLTMTLVSIKSSGLVQRKIRNFTLSHTIQNHYTSGQYRTQPGLNKPLDKLQSSVKACFIAALLLYHL